MDSLDLAKTIAPYATAVIAVAAAAFTAWLSHRNWIKQFEVQRSEALLKERIRLLQEVPGKLTKGLSLAGEAQYALAYSDALAEMKNVEGISTDGHAMLEAQANSSIDKYDSLQESLQELLRELGSLEIIVEIYFGQEASASLVEFTSNLFSLSVPSANRTEVKGAILEAVRSSSYANPDVQSLIPGVLKAVMPHLGPALSRANELRLSVIRAMAARVDAV